MSVSQEIMSMIVDVHDFPKKGIVFKDFMNVFHNPTLLQKLIAEIAQRVEVLRPDYIVGIESRGFLFGVPLALQMNIPFLPARKKGKLPPPVLSQTYALEYGTDTIEIQQSSLIKGKRYLVLDDVVATGGTAGAVAELVAREGAVVAGFAFVIELAFLNGRDVLCKASGLSHESVVSIIEY